MISSVANAMQILEALSVAADGLSIAELQRQTGIEKSAVSRVVTTLQDGGYVRKDDRTELVRLGIRVPAIALGYLEKLGLLEMCEPALAELARETGELIQLATSDGGPPIYIAKAQGRNRIQALPLIGTQAIPHASAAGKLWLASMSDFESIAYIQNSELRQLTSKTKARPEDVIADIRKIRAQGYALIADELSDGVSAIGVPLRTDRFVGALVLGSPSYRASEQVMVSFLPLLRATAPTLASVIGFCLARGTAENKVSNGRKSGETANG